MDPSLAPKPDPTKPKRWYPCSVCKRKVTRAADGKGGTIVVQRVNAHAGDLALTDPLFPGEPLLAVPHAGGLYRAHRCIEKAHSAANFERKSRNGMSDKKYSVN